MGPKKSSGFLLSKGYNNLMRIKTVFSLLFQWALRARHLFVRVRRKEREKRRRMRERRGIFENLRRKLSEIKQRSLHILALYKCSLAYFGTIQIQSCLFWHYTDTVLPILASSCRYSLAYFGIIMQIQSCLFRHHHADTVLPILAIYRYSLAYFGIIMQIQSCLFWHYTDTVLPILVIIQIQSCLFRHYTDTVLPISASSWRYSLTYFGTTQMQSCPFRHHCTNTDTVLHILASSYRYTLSLTL